MEKLNIRYLLKLADGTSEDFDLHIDPESMHLIADPPEETPAWTRLTHCQCPHCPLSPEDFPRCPVALNLVQLVNRFSGVISHDLLQAEVFTPQRHISQETPAQVAVSSLMGLLIATSRCPLTDFFKPMVYFHLPFASEEETIWRATSTYLLAQYFINRRLQHEDYKLEGLSNIYADINKLNIAFSTRMRTAIEQDSTINALILLDIFATSISVVVDDFWDEMEHVFKPFLGSYKQVSDPQHKETPS